MGGAVGQGGDVAPSELRLALAPTDPHRLTLPCFIEEVAERHGDRVAVVSAERAMTYRALAEESERVARSLRTLGIMQGDRVALLLANRPEWVSAFFGAARLGVIVVPVDTFASPDERDFVLRHSGVRLLLMQRDLAGRDFVAELSGNHPELVGSSMAGGIGLAGLPALRSIVCLDGDELPASIEDWPSWLARGDGHCEPRANAVGPEDPALLIYTSGTTDRPKGVLHAQRAPVIQSWRFAEMMALNTDDVVATAQPFFWTAGICMSLGATLAAGACLHVRERFESAAMLETIERHGVTTLHAWPHLQKAMAEDPSARSRDLSTLVHVEFDSPLAPLVGLDADRWGIYSAYGLSETFTLATGHPSWVPSADRRGNHGPPLSGMAVRIVDTETGEPKADGEWGEIAVRGATLMLGYWQVPIEYTLDADGYFHTGDRGRFDERGWLHWSGRLSGLIKTAGANVSPLEVERVAAAQPGVRAAVAVGAPHPTLGEAIVLCIVPTAAHALDVDAIRVALRAGLARYKVPRHVVVIAEEDVPTTSNQKLRADSLRDIVLARMAAEGVEIEGTVYGDR